MQNIFSKLNTSTNVAMIRKNALKIYRLYHIADSSYYRFKQITMSLDLSFFAFILQSRCTYIFLK